jgi:uncharacterized protein involved in outer membrane biogenesis
MKVTKIAMWTTSVILAFIISVCLAILIAMGIGITIPLDGMQDKIDQAVTEALQRQVSIEGPLSVGISFQPSIEIRGFRISNPPGWGGADLARVDLVRGQIHILPLLKGEIRIEELVADGVTVFLETTPAGDQNWSFGPDSESRSEEIAGEPSALEFIEIRHLSLNRLNVTYRDGGVGEDFEFGVDHIMGKAPYGKPLKLDIQGSVENRPYALSFRGAPLNVLKHGREKWRMEVNGHLFGIPLIMAGDIDPTEEIPRGTFHLLSEDGDLGRLFTLIDSDTNIVSTFDRFEINGTARGRHLKELLEMSDLSVRLQGAHALVAGAESQEGLNLDAHEVELNVKSSHPLAGEIRGVIQGEPFSLSVRGDSLAHLAAREEPWGLGMKFQTSGLGGELNGRLNLLNDIPEVEVDFTADNLDIGHLMKWLKSAEEMDAQVGSLALNARFSGKDWQSLVDQSFFGVKLKNGQYTWHNPETGRGIRLVVSHCNIESPRNKPVQLNLKGEVGKTNRAVKRVEKHQAITKTGVQDGMIQPVPIVLNGILQKTSTESQSRQGAKSYRPLDLQLSGNIAASQIEMRGTLDAGAEIPILTMDLAAKKVRVGEMLNWLELAGGVDASSERFSMHLEALGGELEEWLEKSSFSISFENGHWVVKDPNTQASADIQIKEAKIQASAGKPIQLSIDGMLDQEPVGILIETAELTAFGGKRQNLPLRLDANAAGARLTLTSAVDLPLNERDQAFELACSGENLASLDELLAVSLPPIGPYLLKGQFFLEESGYRLSNFRVAVNQSDLTGEMRLDTTGSVPRLDIDLVTNRLQINDFEVGEWSAVNDAGRDDGGAGTGVNDENVKALLNPELMRQLDARVSIGVKEVLSGGDSLGKGSVLMTLSSGKFSVDPLRLDVPGGAVDFSFSYRPTESDVLTTAKARIDRLDYGILARRIDPDTAFGGRISLDVDLDARAKDFNALMRHVNGRIDLAVWPEDFEADIFDLWAINILKAIIPRLDSGPQSRVNCVVGRFDISDGILHQDSLLMDTSRMRINGKARVNFKTEQVDLYLKPRGKRPEFFSLATPVQVKGKFSDFKPGIAPGGLFGTAIRFFTSPLHVPFRRLAGENLPEDGNDVCADSGWREAARNAKP